MPSLWARDSPGQNHKSVSVLQMAAITAQENVYQGTRYKSRISFELGREMPPHLYCVLPVMMVFECRYRRLARGSATSGQRPSLATVS